MTSSQNTKKQSRSLRPLATLLPYVGRYKLQVILAIASLLLAAATTLTLPLAVRRVIDFGFSDGYAQLVDSYFTVLIGIALLLAFASASRYYFVIWIGERVVADLRKDVFNNVTRLSASFFDTARSGEIVSRLTADTTQIKSAVGATASLALRNVLLGTGAITMMIFTSPSLSLIVVGAIPIIILPMVLFGREVRRRSRAAQDTLAEATAYASESISAVSTMQSYTNESFVRGNFAGAVDFAFEAARKAIRTRAMLTAFAIFLPLVGYVFPNSNNASGIIRTTYLDMYKYLAVLVTLLTIIWNTVISTKDGKEKADKVFYIVVYVLWTVLFIVALCFLYWQRLAGLLREKWSDVVTNELISAKSFHPDVKRCKRWKKGFNCDDE